SPHRADLPHLRAARSGRAQIRGRWAARSAEGARTDRCGATLRTGQILEHEEYLPSGESWFEELKNSSANRVSYRRARDQAHRKDRLASPLLAKSPSKVRPRGPSRRPGWV